jgi:L-alanine-DL-glutamate epimerase-like enolase superfamily enzyme
MHDWLGKKMGYPWHRIWGLNPAKTPVTTFTIGIDTKEVVRQKVKEAEEFKVLKVKLGRDNDKEMINAIREVTERMAHDGRILTPLNENEARRVIRELMSAAPSARPASPFLAMG